MSHRSDTPSDYVPTHRVAVDDQQVIAIHLIEVAAVSLPRALFGVGPDAPHPGVFRERAWAVALLREVDRLGERALE